MAKHDAKQDLFNLGADGSDDGDEYVIAQIISADGWRAVFTDEPGVIRTLGLACFALVEFVPSSPEAAQIPQRAIRPMVVDEFGQIEDVEAFDDFLCVVPPGTDQQSTVQFMDRATKIREAAK